MGYVIRYGKMEGVPRWPAIVWSRVGVMAAGFFLVFLLLTGMFWSSGAVALRNLMLPGDPKVTAGALTTLLDDLRAGQPVGESVTAFCVEILSHAEYPD